MQLDYFGDNLAGQEFYEKLQKMLLQPEKKKDVLDVYFLCLSLGFEGKYRVFNPEERAIIMDDLGRKIRRTRIRVSAELSPHGKRAESSAGLKSKTFFFPLWLSGAIAAAAICAGWTGMFIVNNSACRDLLASIQSFMAK